MPQNDVLLRAVMGRPSAGENRFRDESMGTRLSRRSPRAACYRHLVSIKVGIERMAHRMNLDGFSVHQHRLERLNPQPVKRGRAFSITGCS